MPVTWRDEQRTKVEQCLERHPPDSGMCLEAAREILPVAVQLDGGATAWKLVPRRGRLVVPKTVRLARPWWHHFTVSVQAHYVDALTGPDGTIATTYLEEHWQFPEWISMQPDDLREDA